MPEAREASDFHLTLSQRFEVALHARNDISSLFR